MSKTVLLKRNTTANLNAYAGPVGEIVLDTQTLQLVIQNETPGGLRIPRAGGPASFGNLSYSGTFTGIGKLEITNNTTEVGVFKSQQHISTVISDTISGGDYGGGNFSVRKNGLPIGSFLVGSAWSGSSSDNLDVAILAGQTNGNVYIYTNGSLAKNIRFLSSGFAKFSNNGQIGNSAGFGDLSTNPSFHFQSDNNNSVILNIASSGGSTTTNFDAHAPDGTSGLFFQGTKNQVAQFKVFASNGAVVNTSNSYGAISDVKLKTGIVNAPRFLEKFMKIRFVNYNFKENLGLGTDSQFGVIAQEFQEIFPSLVESSEDTVDVVKTKIVEIPEVLDDDGKVLKEASTETVEYTEKELTGEVTLSVKYSVLNAIQGKVIQEQQVLIKSLEDRLSALESKLNGLIDEV